LGDNNVKYYSAELASGMCSIGYTGALCNECEEGYGRVSKTNCYSCS